MGFFDWKSKKSTDDEPDTILVSPIKKSDVRERSGTKKTTDSAPDTIIAPDTAIPEILDPNVIRSFSAVPKFEDILTAGPSAVYPVEQKDRHKYIALSAVGRRAIVLLAENVRKDNTEVMSLTGSLSSQRYILSVHHATKEIIQQIYAGHATATVASETADSKTARKGVNAYMQEVGHWIAYAVDQGATDIHLEIKGSKGFVRVRVDGELEPIRFEGNGVYPAAFIEKAMASLYNNEQQRKSGSDTLFDAGKSLYCMVPYSEIPGHSLKLRYQSTPGNEGPKCVLRLLHVDESVKTLSYEQLGYEKTQIEMWKSAGRTPSGAVLIAGVTGSGKSTTQKSFIELNPSAKEMSIFTVEDPVEYPIAVAHQIPIQRDLTNPEESAKAYANTVAALMRMDPDLVMLGEVRDRYSAQAMQQLAETGHMALGTVHAHLLSGIVPRLTNQEIGLSRDVLSGPNMVTMLVYQALVAKLCQHCALTTSDVEGKDEGIDAMLQAIRHLGLDDSTFRWKRSGGCEHCNSRGTKGQTVVAEMLMPDEDWLRHIRDGRDDLAVEAYRHYSDMNLMSDNMRGKTVFEHTLLKAIKGITDARQCTRFDNPEHFVARFNRLRSKSTKSHP